MIFSSLKTTELIKQIKKLKTIVDNTKENEEKILTSYFEKKITKKEAISKLKNNNLLSDFKKNNKIELELFIDFNNTFSEFTGKLGFDNFPVYEIKEKSFLKNICTVFKTKRKKEKIIKETKPKVKKEKSFLNKIFSSKKKIKEEIPKEEVNKPMFEKPKEILPENYQVLITDFAYAFIKENENERVYVVAEPELTKEEEKILKKTKETLINKISLSDLNDQKQMYNLIDKIFERNKVSIDLESKKKIVYYIIRQVSGLDKIEALMHDPLIEDIECDGMEIPIFIVHRKYGHIVTNIVYNTENELQQFVIKMAHLCKSYVSYASPLLDGILPDGSRVNATLTTNVSTRGPTFTIRKFPQKPLTTIDLVNSETITSEIVAYLWTLIEFKKNIILIGPTAGGKTTLLNVISSFIPEAQRVVSIEDTREINLLLENWIPQITRPGFGPPDSTGKRYGEITMNDLLKESFRQRPDYLIIGEVRGEEMALMFQGMASGHSSLSTVHSKSTEGLITRITTPPISLDPSLITSLDVVVVTGFSGIKQHKREVKEINEIKGFNKNNNKVDYNIIYKASDKFKKKSVTSESDLFTKELPIVYNSDTLKDICEEFNITKTKMSEIISNRTKFIEDLTKNPPKDHFEFNKFLKEYKRKEILK